MGNQGGRPVLFNPSDLAGSGAGGRQQHRRAPGPATRFSRVKPVSKQLVDPLSDKKMPIVTPKQSCRLRLLRLQRMHDYLVMENEYLDLAVAARGRVASKDDGDTENPRSVENTPVNQNELKKVEALRGTPMIVVNVEECVDDNHLIVTTASSAREWYVPILSFVNANLVGPNSSALAKTSAGGRNTPGAVVGALPPEMEASTLASGFVVEKAPAETYDEIGGLESVVREVKEAVELPLTNPELYTEMGIQPPCGVILYGPPGTGKTLLAKAVANMTSATFLRCVGSQLIQRTAGDGSKMVRALFQMARDHAPSVVFIDEIDAIGTKRYDTTSSGEKEVQRVLLELLNQLDGFDSLGDVKVILATNRIDTLDPALIRPGASPGPWSGTAPGRIDRKIEVPAPDESSRRKIFDIHTKQMTLAKEVTYAKVFMKDENVSGADIKAVCTEAGMRALRARRRFATLEDFKEAVASVLRQNEPGHAAFFL